MEALELAMEACNQRVHMNGHVGNVGEVSCGHDDGGDVGAAIPKLVLCCRRPQ